MVAAVRFKVKRSTSAKTGIAPWYRIGVRAPMSVMDVVTISSPGLGSIAATAMCTAAVPEEQACAFFTPRVAAKRSSRILVKEPLVLVKVPE